MTPDARSPMPAYADGFRAREDRDIDRALTDKLCVGIIPPE
jgi:hypothetical protein